MRLRKIHAIAAVSIALVLVARSIDSRRRLLEGPPPKPLGETPHDPQVEARPDEWTEHEPLPPMDVDASATGGLSTPDHDVADLDPSPPAGKSTVEVNAVTPQEPAALVAELVAGEPAAPESPGAEPDVSWRRRWVPSGPVAVAVTVMVLMAILAGALAAAALGGVID